MCRSAIPLPSENSCDVMRQLDKTYYPEEKQCFPDACWIMIYAETIKVWGQRFAILWDFLFLIAKLWLFKLHALNESNRQTVGIAVCNIFYWFILLNQCFHYSSWIMSYWKVNSEISGKSCAFRPGDFETNQVGLCRCLKWGGFPDMFLLVGLNS